MNDPAPAIPRSRRFSEDWLAVFLGITVLCVSMVSVWVAHGDELTQTAEQIAASTDKSEVKKLTKGAASLSPLKPWVNKPQEWTSSPVEALSAKGKSIVPGIFGAGGILLVLFAVGIVLRGENLQRFAGAFVVVFLLSVLAYLLASQSVIHHYNLEYALWALLVGLLISNIIGTPAWLKPAVRTEFYIKTGLVLLGAEVLFGKLLALGLPGICIAWIVTPIVLVTTYLFGQYVLRIESRSLNMVISADMSVCGVSAAIATAASCKAKKEELSTAISMSLMFTVIMMMVMPAVVRATGMDPVIGGAWMGGTIDSTGAVAAAGELISPAAGDVAATIKMIQNVLIGVVSFCVAVYWVTFVERNENSTRPGLSEIWVRFPKFVLGFLAASIVCSLIAGAATGGVFGELFVSASTAATKGLRGWCFCLAFVCIGLETNFSELAKTLKGGKPLVLYVCGQSLNLALTLFMAWLMFDKVFPQAKAVLNQ